MQVTELCVHDTPEVHSVVVIRFGPFHPRLEQLHMLWYASAQRLGPEKQ